MTSMLLRLADPGFPAACRGLDPRLPLHFPRSCSGQNVALDASPGPLGVVAPELAWQRDPLPTARTWFEDRMLRAELAEFAEYALQVNKRLVPLVW